MTLSGLFSWPILARVFTHIMFLQLYVYIERESISARACSNRGEECWARGRLSVVGLLPYPFPAPADLTCTPRLRVALCACWRRGRRPACRELALLRGNSRPAALPRARATLTHTLARATHPAHAQMAQQLKESQQKRWF